MAHNKTIKSVGIVGAGALGLLYMEAISKNTSVQSYFLTDTKRYTLFKDKEFLINSRKVTFKTKRADDLSEKPDLLLICVKNHHLDSIKDLLAESAGPETIIVSVLNGISSEIYLEKQLPDSTVLYCAVLGMDAVKEGEALNYTRTGKFLLGSRKNTKTKELIKVCAFLRTCSIEHIIPKDIHRELWYKWMINIGVNQISAVTGANYGLFQKNRTVQDLMDDAMLETIDVAQAENINLKSDDIDKWYTVLNTLGPEGKTSMLQDVEAGRKTEVESFSGELLKRAEKHGIKAPVNETLFRILKIREQFK